MAEKRYNANATTDWFTPANWTPVGVPTVDDTVVRDAASAPCMLTAEAVCGEFISEPNAQDNFNLNNQTLCVGKDGAGRHWWMNPIYNTTGIVRFHGHDMYVGQITSTSYSSIHYEFFSPCVFQQYSANSVRRMTIRGGGVLRPDPAPKQYNGASLTRLQAYQSQGYGVTIDVGGIFDMSLVDATLRLGSGATQIINNGKIVNTSSVLRTLMFSGVSNAQCGIVDGDIDIDITTRVNDCNLSGTMHTARTVVFGSTPNAAFGGIVVADGTTLPDCEIKDGAIASNVSGRVICYGDFVITSSGFVSANGLIMELAGSADQIIDIAQAHLGGEAATHIELAKPSGSLTIHASFAVCMAGRQPGLLQLSGTADYTVCGDLELFSEPDTSELAGTFTPGPGAVLFRPVYVDMGYLSKRFVTGNGGTTAATTADWGVIQDVRNYTR